MTDTKQYGVWSESKDGFDNGKWDTFVPMDKNVCEELVRRWNRNCPHFKHEVRELPEKQQ